MVRLLLVAHAPLASAFLQVARHVFSDCGASVRAVDVPDSSDLSAAEAAIRRTILAEPEADWLVLADVFGATPCNAAVAVADGSRIRVVAGLSVPMLWRTLCYCDRPLDDLVLRAVAGAGQGAFHVAVTKRQNQPGFGPPDDHHPNHDQ
jgi:mannose PTS system EIIA component